MALVWGNCDSRLISFQWKNNFSATWQKYVVSNSVGVEERNRSTTLTRVSSHKEADDLDEVELARGQFGQIRK